MDLGLSGRTALVTGSSKGIGRAVAERLASEGVAITLVARSSAELDQTARDIRALHPVRVDTLAADLTLEADRERIITTCGEADILVNSAGSIPGGTVEDVDDARWRAAWDLKVFGCISLCRAFFTRMKARRSGVIINMIGTAGERLDAGYIAGSTGNAALMAFTRALGSTSADVGVRVVGVNPGPVETDRLITLQKLKARKRLGDESRWRELYAAMPFGRAATPDEVAATTVFLASDLCGYTTGAIFTIDGGIASRGELP
jgi:NAD(P)-dependent dehydrogenase (short-subunit alcohol dehydrogenase family)